MGKKNAKEKANNGFDASNQFDTCFIKLCIDSTTVLGSATNAANHS